MARELRAATLLILGALAVPAVASADRVVLVDPDDGWREAVEIALDPWGHEVLTAPAPSPSPPTAAALGAEVAGRTGAALVVWIAPEGAGGSTLWIYDADARAAEGRWVPASRPLDAATAASLALSVKAHLRHRRARVVAPPAPPVATVAPAPPAPPPPRDAWTIEAALGPRVLATSPDRAELRVAIGAAWWPAALAGHLGIGLRASSGPGIEHRDDHLEARWVDSALELVVAGRWAPVEPLELRLEVGAGGHLTHLGGVVLDGQHAVDRWHGYPSASAAFAAGVRPARRLFFGVRGGVEVPLLVQRYRLAGEPRLEITRHAIGVMVLLEIDLG